MKRFDRTRFKAYRRRFRSIDGWLHPFTSWLIFELSCGQANLGVGGSVVEIGVHHGKSFLPMYLGTEKHDPAIAIDVFEMQQYNMDRSGKGDRDKFLDNIKTIAGTMDGVTMITNSSELVTPNEILKWGRVRMFSIDGSHTEEATLADLRLALATLCDGGVIFLDDLFNESWPEVVGATARFLGQIDNIAPVILMPGKVMLCDRNFISVYREWCHLRFGDWIDFEKKLFGEKIIGVSISGRFTRRRIRNTGIGKRIAAVKKALIG